MAVVVVVTLADTPLEVLAAAVVGHGARHGIGILIGSAAAAAAAGDPGAKRIADIPVMGCVLSNQEVTMTTGHGGVEPAGLTGAGAMAGGGIQAKRATGARLRVTLWHFLFRSI